MTDAKLTDASVDRALSPLHPDRDEKASPLCTETLLAILANADNGPDDGLKSARVENFALRSLVFGENFLAGREGLVGDGPLSVADYGEKLSKAEDFMGAENLPLTRKALASLIDNDTEVGQRGEHLLMPFHESLLWYDARKSSGSWSVRQVRMRVTGFGIARILLESHPDMGPEAQGNARNAKDRLVEYLKAPSPFLTFTEKLEGPLCSDESGSASALGPETDAWERAAHAEMAPFAEQLSRHLRGVTDQGGRSPTDCLWQTRSILALDLAIGFLNRCWEIAGTPADHRFLLVSAPGLERNTDKVRRASERSHKATMSTLRDASVEIISTTMEALETSRGIIWEDHLTLREGPAKKRVWEAVIEPYQAGVRDFPLLANRLYKSGTYTRASGGYRTLLGGIGFYAGGTRYRYQTFSPELLRALVGSLSAEMPMESGAFFRRLKEEWGFVVSDEGAQETCFDVPGSELAANKARFEDILVRSGLASSMSDTTVVVGERAGRQNGA